MISWHEARFITGVANAGAISSVPDHSGHGVTLTVAANKPTLDIDRANGREAIMFDGSNDPLIYGSALDQPKHIFTIAAYDDDTFAGYSGLIGPITSGADILVGEDGGTKFFNFTHGANYSYKRRAVALAESDQQAPMNDSLMIMEVVDSDGLSLTDFEIGQHRDHVDRKWNGPFVLNIMWSRILADVEVAAMYEYIACVYKLWRQTASGLNIWPFDPDWGRPMPRHKPVLSSTAVSGSSKSRSKGDKKRSVDAKFEDRFPEEFLAGEAFWDDHYPGTSFNYRDAAVSPSQDITMRFTSDLQEQSSDYRSSSYSFQATEV
jgi:hypothetical protein